MLEQLSARFHWMIRTFATKANSRYPRQPFWEEKWARRLPAVEKHRPRLWKSSRIPAPLRDAVASQWLHAGGRTVDIGCGWGECAGWLALQGFPVVGVDFVPAIIEQARSFHAEFGDNPQFMVADFLADVSHLGSFDNALDKSCFHGILPAWRDRYLDNLTKCLKPGGRLVLIRSANSAKSVRTTQTLFEQQFDIVQSIAIANMGRNPEKRQRGQPIPYIAYRMIRR